MTVAVHMNRCPSLDHLRKLLDATLGDDSRCVTEAHVKCCTACQKTLTDLRDETDVADWRRRLRTDARALQGEETDRLKQFLEELKSNPPLQIDQTRQRVRHGVEIGADA